ncbi:hypothetical protein [Haloarcula sp. JP-L23]|uniref:hypothetical protein n=1 Tax=Haloarcula sp. JP-L23 TaxID=2716717 RepID=UPI00140F2106|nr:hypothetical protein G9465_07260 [Haloarcula sp. JP-L23]
MSESAGVPEPDFEELRAAVERLLDETVDREDALAVSVEDLEVDVPIRFGDDAPRARWRFDGDVTVTVDGIRQPLREWIELHEERTVERPSDD